MNLSSYRKIDWTDHLLCQPLPSIVKHPLRVKRIEPILVIVKHYLFSTLFPLTIAKSLREDLILHTHHHLSVVSMVWTLRNHWSLPISALEAWRCNQAWLRDQEAKLKKGLENGVIKITTLFIFSLYSLEMDQSKPH